MQLEVVREVLAMRMSVRLRDQWEEEVTGRAVRGMVWACGSWPPVQAAVCISGSADSSTSWTRLRRRDQHT